MLNTSKHDIYKLTYAGKHNSYKIIDKCQNEDGTQKWYKLECVDFYDVDDLGDLILCNRVGWQGWIANYFFQHMPILPFDIDGNYLKALDN